MQHMQGNNRRAWDTHTQAHAQDAHRTLLRVCAPAQKPVHKLSIINMQNFAYVCLCVCAHGEKRVEFKHQVKVRKGRQRKGSDDSGSGSDMSKIKNSRQRRRLQTLQREAARNKWKLHNAHDARDTRRCDVAATWTMRSFSARRRLATTLPQTQTFSFASFYGILLLCPTGALLRSSRNNP